MSREGLPFNPEDAGLEATGDGPYPQGDIPELESAASEQRRLEAERVEAKQRKEEEYALNYGRLYEKAGFWGRMKLDLKDTMRRGTIGERTTVASVLALVGWMGASEMQKVHEYVRMGQKEKQLQVELAETERLKQKEDQVREMFGINPRFLIPEHDVIDAKQDLLAAERKKFTFAPIVVDPDDQYRYEEARDRLHRLEHPELGTEHEPTEIKTDLVAHNGYQDVRISREQLGVYVNGTFPRGWVSNEVASIEQTDVRVPSDERYGIVGGEAAAACRRGQDRDTIVFYGGSKTEYMGSVLRGTLPHELGHANDWESDAEMSGEERLDLLVAVGERLGSEDRYRSAYVEKINNPDEKRELYTKAVEYWAEICSQYFRNPEAMDVKDFQLVDARVRKVDPDYDADECRSERQEVVLDILFPNR